ncbi:hypothetical protein Rhal01_03337 [Rubritalea halochordaticola]|uniref:L,D-TPase catalytic domain-containing protein n=1 Tax=Rubritalea halochordaticola TaxID=714537 RepID=A0ABP9V711_9BACT
MSSELNILVSVAEQTLELRKGNEVLHRYSISTAANGTGFQEGSYCTPTGRFIVSEKFGHEEPIHTTFKGRLPTGIWDPCECCEDDLITSRILWLDGLDEDNANSKARYIYIHGTNHEDKIGTPASCGCVRMRNEDIIELFELVPELTLVIIS